MNAELAKKSLLEPEVIRQTEGQLGVQYIGTRKNESDVDALYAKTLLKLDTKEKLLLNSLVDYIDVFHERAGGSVMNGNYKNTDTSYTRIYNVSDDTTADDLRTELTQLLQRFIRNPLTCLAVDPSTLSDPYQHFAAHPSSQLLTFLLKQDKKDIEKLVASVLVLEQGSNAREKVASTLSYNITLLLTTLSTHQRYSDLYAIARMLDRFKLTPCADFYKAAAKDNIIEAKFELERLELEGNMNINSNTIEPATNASYFSLFFKTLSAVTFGLEGSRQFKNIVRYAEDGSAHASAWLAKYYEDYHDSDKAEMYYRMVIDNNNQYTDPEILNSAKKALAENKNFTRTN